MTRKNGQFFNKKKKKNFVTLSVSYFQSTMQETPPLNPLHGFLWPVH